EQEEHVTTQINALLSMAKAESDYTADNFLQWFVKEQLEEVASMGQLLRVVQRAGEGNLLRVEEYLARGKDRGALLARKNDRANRGRAVPQNPGGRKAENLLFWLLRAGKSENQTPFGASYWDRRQTQRRDGKTPTRLAD